MGETYKGVDLSSRMDVESEIATMRGMVDWLGTLAKTYTLVGWNPRFLSVLAQSMYLKRIR